MLLERVLLERVLLERVLPARLVGYVAAAVGVLLVTALIGGVLRVWEVGNLFVLYLVVVLATAVRFGIGPALLASLASFLAFNWFHVQPLHTFAVADPAEWVVAPARSPSATGPGRRWVRVHDPRREVARNTPRKVTFVPLRAADRTLGVLRLAQPPDAPAWTDEETRLVDVAAD